MEMDVFLEDLLNRHLVFKAIPILVLELTFTSHPELITTSMTSTRFWTFRICTFGMAVIKPVGGVARWTPATPPELTKWLEVYSRHLLPLPLFNDLKFGDKA
jgi:hypothetical protein